MSTSTTVSCPACSTNLKLKSRASLGQRRNCPRCGEPFVLRANEEQDQSPNPVSSRADARADAPGSPASSEPAQADFQPDRQTFARVIEPFLKTHCLRCHSSETQEGDFRIDQQLPNDFLNRSVTEKWSEVLNMLNAGDMPPKGEPKPTAAAVAKVTDWIVGERLRAERARLDGTIVLRRMNREEYNNTIRDLIGVKMQLVDEFPEDPPAGGFDNNGGALSISPLHLERYLETAQKILDRAIVTTEQQPTPIKWQRFEFEEARGTLRVRLDDRNRNVNISGAGGLNTVRNGLVAIRRWGRYCGVQHFLVPYPGNYIVRIRAAGVTPSEKAAREAGPRIDQLEKGYEKGSRPWVEKHFATDRSYRYGPPRLKMRSRLGSLTRIDVEMDIDAPESSPKIYEVRTWLTPEDAQILLTNEYRIPYNHINQLHERSEAFPRPELLIDWMEIEGPVYDAWPPSSHRRILIDSPNKGGNEAAYARDVLANFMWRAYRRPLREGELEPFVALFQQVRGNKPSFTEAIKVPLSAILTSPDFLFLVEEKNFGQSLDHFELASRLSYFLWSSMPDGELFELADSGKLNSPATLRAQVDRMLADEKSTALVKNFTGQWLRLREVGANPPVRDIYPRYDDHLEISMRGESEAFFEHILQGDRSALEFLSSDYMTINERLARFYDIPGVKGDHFRVVKVPPGMQRGGLVTQASILSVTSNGTRTSPVLRGVWILENLLGNPPPPPPPNAGDIPASATQGRNRVTVRQRLRLHRGNLQCARCHNKIDPLGFALENFAASGEWRDRELRIYMSLTQNDGPVIDAKSQLPDGTEFVGVEGLRTELLKRKDQFLLCLARKMFTYALGRELCYADDPIVDDAVESMNAHKQTLRSLIHHIVISDLFQTK